MDLPADMRRVRKERGIDQATLGTMLNVSQEMISMIESGAKQVPSELAPIIRRWIITGRGPGKSELATRKTARHETSGKGR